jgi:hypothetical protein
MVLDTLYFAPIQGSRKYHLFGSFMVRGRSNHHTFCYFTMLGLDLNHPDSDFWDEQSFGRIQEF